MTGGGRFLVTGATGKVGREVVSGLLERGAGVRALARDPGAAKLPEGVGVMRGDLTIPDTLEPALEGVEAVFLLWPVFGDSAPETLDAIGRHARRVVYLSSMGVRDDLVAQADPINQSHADMERRIERSGLGWTFLRPSGFASNTLGWAEQVRARGVVRAPYGGAKRSLIHERDIADVAVLALAEHGHVGKKHVITGPEALAQSEQARLIGEAAGRPVRWEEMPRTEAREELAAAFGDAAIADGALDTWAGFVTQPEPVTRAFEELTGKRPRTFRRWAEDHAGAFGRTAPLPRTGRRFE